MLGSSSQTQRSSAARLRSDASSSVTLQRHVAQISMQADENDAVSDQQLSELLSSASASSASLPESVTEQHIADMLQTGILTPQGEEGTGQWVQLPRQQQAARPVMRPFGGQAQTFSAGRQPIAAHTALTQQDSQAQTAQQRQGQAQADGSAALSSQPPAPRWQASFADAHAGNIGQDSAVQTPQVKLHT